ncbi:hypothetical protein K502DRAFT_366726 [Neoconidiobolus thromboides FSU 785]|nr:hypothetical protein K502DRAFT_366726 [Neoconidiobolus thromboides FSU 785]
MDFNCENEDYNQPNKSNDDSDNLESGENFDSSDIEDADEEEDGVVIEVKEIRTITIKIQFF